MAIDLKELRRAIADYIASEGCSCCRNGEAHAEAAERIGKMLAIPKYSDGSGRNFGLFRTDGPGRRSGNAK